MIIQRYSASLMLFITVTLVAGCMNKKEPASLPVKTDQKEFVKSKKQSGLTPQELFFYDRNYPEYIIEKDLFQERLTRLIRHDAAATRSKRGLDHPWTIQGPGNIGGRVNAIAVDPTDHATILLGYAQGGIYRSEDNGTTWNAVFDDQPSLAIGSIAFDPQTPTTVYATTGDVNISGYPFIGAGVFRSEDNGKTWAFAGLDHKGVLSKVLVDPTDSDVIYVGSMGFPSHKGDEKGFWRSDDRGQSWNKTLTIDDSTGVIDIAVDPTQPGRVLASGYTRLRTSKYSNTTGPGSGLYRSDDYGLTWINLVNGLPETPHSRTSLEVTNNGTVFMSYIGTIEDGECSGYQESLKAVYRSFDGGFGWEQVNTDPVFGLPCELLGGFGWYFDVLKVNPNNPLDIFLLGVDLYRTLDGGLSWFEAAPTWWLYDVHADKHDLVFAGSDILLATDGGAYRQPINASAPWADIENIVSTQFYRTTFNPHMPDQYYGGAQDNGTTGGNKTFINDWPRIFGGDGFQPLFDPDEPGWMYFLTQYGDIWYSTDSLSSVDRLTQGLQGTRYWDMPFVMSAHDPRILFCGSSSVYTINMNDSVREWHSISPDLTRGEIILGNRYPAITAIAQSALDADRIYAGTQDGKLWTTPDGGDSWIDISDGTPGWIVTSITTSTVDPQTVFVTVTGYRENDHTPYIYRSDNAGAAWIGLGNDIPMLGVNSFMILPEWNDDVMFAATDGGVYVSQDAGTMWERVGTNFPHMPVYDLEFNPVTNELVAATFSRGLMTFPVEELDLVSAIDPNHPVVFSSVQVYPTVAKESLIIDTQNSSSEKIVGITIMNTNGYQLYAANADMEDRDKMTIRLSSDWPQGIYFLTLSNPAGAQRVFRFVKE